MKNKLLCLVVAGSVTGACGQVIGISDYEIDLDLGQGGAGHSSRGGNGGRPMGGSQSDGGKVGGGVGGAGGAGAVIHGGGAHEAGAGGSDSMMGGQGGGNAGGAGTVVPGCSGQLLLGADFDTERSAWTEYSQLDFLPLISHEDATAVYAESGKYVTWMGGLNDDLQSISQPIQIPVGAKTLVFTGYFQLFSANPVATNSDLGSASLWDPVGSEIVGIFPVWDPTQENLDWKPFSYTIDVSALGGKSLDFQVVVGMDSTDVTSFFFDTLSLIACN